MVACLSFALLSLSGCSPESLIGLSGDAPSEPMPARVDSGQVTDLEVSVATDSSVTVAWTEVDNGSGKPAAYRLKHALPPIDWQSATHGCDGTIAGVQIGARMSCTVQGLTESTRYDFQLMSYRHRNSGWMDGVYSNVATGTTSATTSALPSHGVSDLAVVSSTDATLDLRWTQVDDGSGQPAKYRVKYATPTLTDWSTAAIGCSRTIEGTSIGAEITCTIEGLTASTAYEIQLMSYRTDSSGAWVDARYSNVASGSTSAVIAQPATPRGVSDLTVQLQGQTTLTVGWTQVDDGTGAPAKYRVKYETPSMTNWSSATIGCASTIVGTAIGAPMSCTIQGLTSETAYDVQLMSYRTDSSGAWLDAVYSNIATGATLSTTLLPQASSEGFWISRGELAALPMSGTAWNNVLSEANSSCGSVDLANQDQRNNVCILAKALVFARTGSTSYRSDVVSAIRQIVNAPPYVGRALALGRELAAYVIAADLIDLKSLDSGLDSDFRAELRELRTTYTSDGPSDLINCHERRPNNWGTMCGASRAAVAAYLGDKADLDRTALVFRGWLGERSAYAGFVYGSDLSWHCDPTRPVGINPSGCTRYGQDLGGILPDDQRRGGSYTWPPTKENYVWEALQGAITQAVILERAGYPAFQWGDRALYRAVEWLHSVANYPAEGDDRWQPHLLNHYYGASYPAPVPTTPGKIMGWTDWTHPR